MEAIIPSPLIVKAYDNTSSKVMATFKATCKVVPLDSVMDFQVMDITPSYNLFLGREWLHPIVAIPSTLHQKLKIQWKGEVVEIHADGEILALELLLN